jgi:hypothetical protein
MSLRPPDGYSYPSATEALRRAEKAIEENRKQERKDHYDAVFGAILKAAKQGERSVCLEARQIGKFDTRKHLEKKGYEIGEPFTRHSPLAGGRLTFHYVFWGKEKGNTDVVEGDCNETV